MSLRVLHVLNDLRGGATMSAMALMREGLRRGSEIEHFAVYPGRSGEKPPVLEGVATDWQAVPFRTWQKQRWQSAVGFLRWLKTQLTSGFGARGRRALGKVIKKWNIHVVHTNTAIVRDGALVASLLGLPHLWHIRERIGTGGFMEFPLAEGETVRHISALSVKVPVISKYVREIFSRHGFEGVTELVHDGVDVHALQDPGAVARGRLLRERWGIPPDSILIGMVGGLKTVVKRHDLFLDMAGIIVEQLPGARFAIFGAVPPPVERRGKTWAGKILTRAEEGKLNGRVVFPGFVPDMPAAWSAMDIYVHLCSIEGFSRAILEAMASGTPVVAAAGGGNPEAITDGETGLLVTRQEAAAYAECVRTLVQEPALRREISQRSSTVATRQFSVEAHYAAMSRIFENAAAQGTAW